MTREQSINVLENGEWWDNLDVWYETANPEFEKLHDAVGMAIAALRAQQEAEKNEPLTLEELREMAKCLTEFCYIEETGFPLCSAIIDFDTEGRWGDTGDIIAVESAYGEPLLEKDYGKTWLAYRHKPKEGTI